MIFSQENAQLIIDCLSGLPIPHDKALAIWALMSFAYAIYVFIRESDEIGSHFPMSVIAFFAPTVIFIVMPIMIFVGCAAVEWSVLTLIGAS